MKTARQMRDDLRHVRQMLIAAQKNMAADTFAALRVTEALALVNGCLAWREPRPSESPAASLVFPFVHCPGCGAALQADAKSPLCSRCQPPEPPAQGVEAPVDGEFPMVWSQGKEHGGVLELNGDPAGVIYEATHCALIVERMNEPKAEERGGAHCACDGYRVCSYHLGAGR